MIDVAAQDVGGLFEKGVQLRLRHAAQRHGDGLGFSHVPDFPSVEAMRGDEEHPTTAGAAMEGKTRLVASRPRGGT